MAQIIGTIPTGNEFILASTPSTLMDAALGFCSATYLMTTRVPSNGKTGATVHCTAVLRGQLLSTKSARNRNSPRPARGHQVSCPRRPFPGVGV